MEWHYSHWPFQFKGDARQPPSVYKEYTATNHHPCMCIYTCTKRRYGIQRCMILRSWSLTKAKIMKRFKNPGILNDSINMRSISAGSFTTSNEDDHSLCHTQAAHGFSWHWPGFNTRIIHVDLWWRKWKWGNFPPKSLIFTPLLNIPPMLHTHLPSGVGAICPSEAAIPQYFTHPLICWQLHYVHWYFLLYQFS